ncbi:MAG: UDP-glucose--hexose-1-phosphate uridylyltransferase [Armatimonadetes bacterium]|nr:UDP-glucose--hexose-1-phosphate uridylyltransferase [Armatimonadota bacterium]
MAFSLTDHPHRRYNPLTREWVLVSPHRTKRPWQGQTDRPATAERPAYDPECYLCPGNERAGGERNPDYESVYVFNNDFAALLPDAPEGGNSPAPGPTPSAGDGDAKTRSLFCARSERGICRVICFSPRHDLTLPRMEVDQIRSVVDAWTEQYREIGAKEFIRHVQIFENRGAMMGASNPHPHGQIWATESIPLIPHREIEAQAEYMQEHGSCLLCDYGRSERERGERTVVETAHWLAVAPFWAVWPFETLVLPKAHRASLLELDEEERGDLAALLKELTTRYDNLFLTSFPYSMGIHQAPTEGLTPDGYHMHLHFFPPLLRSAEVRKHMVGYEMLGEPQRDITPESAAERIRQVSATHYLSEG